MTGGKKSIAFIPVDPQQVIVPDSLKRYTKDLPTREFLLQYKYDKRRNLDYHIAQKLPNKREKWNDADMME
jgi:hypothetical protein